ncbi:hypothetical protein [Aquifex sp.]
MDLRAVFGIYNYIKSRGGWIKTEDILKYAQRFNLSRRNFYNYLNVLEKYGLIESKKEGKIKFWRAYDSLNNLDFADEEFIGFIVFLLGNLNPNAKEDLKYFIDSFINKFFGREIDSILDRSYITREFVYNYKGDFLKKLGAVSKSILEQKSINLKIRDNVVHIVPQKLFFIDGEVRVLGYDVSTEKKVNLNLLSVESVTPVGHVPVTKALNFTDLVNPFVFSIAYHEVYMHLEEEPSYVFPTQFYWEKKDNYYVHYLVGSTSDRFVQVFLTILYDRINPPDKDTLILANKLRLDKRFPGLVVNDLNENLKRFLIFLETLEKHLDIRNSVVKNLKYELRMRR